MVKSKANMCLKLLVCFAATIFCGQVSCFIVFPQPQIPQLFPDLINRNLHVCWHIQTACNSNSSQRALGLVKLWFVFFAHYCPMHLRVPNQYVSLFNDRLSCWRICRRPPPLMVDCNQTLRQVLHEFTESFHNRVSTDSHAKLCEIIEIHSSSLLVFPCFFITKRQSAVQGERVLPSCLWLLCIGDEMCVRVILTASLPKKKKVLLSHIKLSYYCCIWQDIRFFFQLCDISMF